MERSPQRAGSRPGYDTSTSSWVSEAETSNPAHAVAPTFQGELLLSPVEREARSTDEGNLTSIRPGAVLRPASVEDIELLVRFCRRHRIFVSARGQGHTTHGQALCSGVVVDMGSLSDIHSISAEGAVVDAGVLWKDLVLATHELGLTPPVLTGYTALSVGGTLSVGGVSSRPFEGTQSDHVQELEVVTGAGNRLSCSSHENAELFRGVLGGLGQCGVITRAKVDLVRAPSRVRTYNLHYSNNASFFADLRRLLARRELSEVATTWLPEGAGTFRYQLNAAVYYDASAPPNDAFLLRDLSLRPSDAEQHDHAFLDHVLRVDSRVGDFRKRTPWDRLVKPWFDVFVPDSTIEEYIQEVLPTLDASDVGEFGFLLLFPLERSKLKNPFVRVPEAHRGEWVYLFDILNASEGPGPQLDFSSRMLKRNRKLYELARAAGGTRYPIGALDFDARDWREHYGETWLDFLDLKERFDPDRILAPGAGIFEQPA